MKALLRKTHSQSSLDRACQDQKLGLRFYGQRIGRHSEMVPPRRLRGFIGSSDYRATGEFLSYFRNLCGLQPQHRVLDVGCGIGRMAVPLTEYLSSADSYEGIDIVPQGIAWCSVNITPKFPNFRFQLADVFSKYYNPVSRTLASEYRFPFPDDSFDLVFLTSVFTHMLAEEVINYLGELNRVLKPGGKCLITWLILNQKSEELIAEGESSLNGIHALGECRVADLKFPEEAVGYPENSIRAMYQHAGLVIEPPIRYGAWCGRDAFLSYQGYLHREQNKLICTLL